MRCALVTTAAVCTLLGAGDARAAACCVSSTAFGVGRLAVWEQGAALAFFAANASPGYWNESAKFVPNTPGTSDVELRPSLAGLVRIHERVQLSARVPWLVNLKSAGSVHDVAAFFGDSMLAVRLEPIGIGEYDAVPGIAVTVSATLPTGRPMSQTKTALAADVTGRGAWVPAVGLTLEQTWGRWYLQGNVGLAVPLPMPGFAPGVTQRFGPAVDVTLAGGVELRPGLVLSLVLRANVESALHVGDEPVTNSQAFDWGAGPALSWRVHPNWTLLAFADTGVFTDFMGDNRPGRLTASVGVRRGFF